MVNIAICDDSISIATSMETMLLKYSEEEKILFDIDLFSNPQELIKHFSHGKVYDLIFLDIEMGRITGIDVATYLREESLNSYTTIVFFSSYISYHNLLFNVTPSGFLEKPVKYGELKTTLDNTLMRINNNKKSCEFFYYTINGKTTIQKSSEIIYFESIKREIKIYSKDKSPKLFYATIDEVLDQINSDFFLRCHKSYIVNLSAIVKIETNSIELESGFNIPIGRKFRENFHVKLGKYYNEH